jgi:hypothetical protein
VIVCWGEVWHVVRGECVVGRIVGGERITSASVNSGGAETQRAKHGLCPPANMIASGRIHVKGCIQTSLF